MICIKTKGRKRKEASRAMIMCIQYRSSETKE